MSYQPSISAVIPTFNRAKQVQAALASVLAQTYPELEVIVVDDGSTDGTSEAIQEIIRSQGPSKKQIRYFFQPNQGPSAARNKGIEKSRGEWVAFLDSDDVWLPDKLELQVQAIRQFRDCCRACLTDATMVNNLGLDASTFRSFGRRCDQTVGIASDAVLSLAKGFCGFWISTLLVQADVVRHMGSFDPEIQCHEDRDFYFRLALSTPLAYIDKPLVRTDRSSSLAGSTCRPWDKWQVRLCASQLMYEKWLTLGAWLPADVRLIVEQNLRSVHSHWANWHLEHEQYHEAREATSRALRYEFTYKLAIKWMLARIAPTFARKVILGSGEDSAVHSR
jgi:glycosyltransferase involved in cell wall biosynthesis